MGIVNRFASVFGIRVGDSLGKETQLNGIRVSSGLAYNSDAHGGHFLDIIKSKEPANPIPVVIYLNGTGFHHTNRSRGGNICRIIAKRDFVAVNAEFRDLRKGITIKDELEDIRCFMGWLKNNSEQFDMDLDNVYVVASSYGALMAVWMTLMCNSDRLPNALGGDRPPFRIKGLGLLTGRTDTNSGDSKMRQIAEALRKLRRTDEELVATLDLWTNHDLRLMPPVFQVTSDSDSAYPDVVRLDRLLETNRIPHETMEFEGSHRTVNGFMEHKATSNECARVLSAMFRFFRDNQ